MAPLSRLLFVGGAFSVAGWRKRQHHFQRKHPRGPETLITEGTLAWAACSSPWPVHLLCKSMCRPFLHSLACSAPLVAAHVCSIRWCLCSLSYSIPHAQAHAHGLFLVKHGLSAAVQTTVSLRRKPGPRLVFQAGGVFKKRSSEQWGMGRAGATWRNAIIYSELSLLTGGKGAHGRTIASVLCCAFWL